MRENSIYPGAAIKLIYSTYSYLRKEFKIPTSNDWVSTPTSCFYMKRTTNTPVFWIYCKFYRLACFAILSAERVIEKTDKDKQNTCVWDYIYGNQLLQPPIFMSSVFLERAASGKKKMESITENLGPAFQSNCLFIKRIMLESIDKIRRTATATS